MRCQARHKGKRCTRPHGHSGAHIAYTGSKARGNRAALMWGEGDHGLSPEVMERLGARETATSEEG